MSQSELSGSAAGITNRLRRRTQIAARRIQESSSSPAGEPPAPRFAHYTRVGAKLARAADLVRRDTNKELPPVSVNDLERAVTVFLDEVRLGLREEGSSSTRASSTTRGHYGREMDLEIRDPDRAARVRANRAAVKDDIHQQFLRRQRR